MRADHGLARLTDAAKVRWIGTVSYGVYLFHVSAISAWKRILPAAWLSAPLVFALSLAVSLALAGASPRAAGSKRRSCAWAITFAGLAPFAPGRSQSA